MPTPASAASSRPETSQLHSPAHLSALGRPPIRTEYRLVAEDGAPHSPHPISSTSPHTADRMFLSSLKGKGTTSYIEYKVSFALVCSTMSDHWGTPLCLREVVFSRFDGISSE